MEHLSIEQRLFEAASLQQGYFTSQQAKKAGYSDSRFTYHVKKGRWVREGRGIYRLASYPLGDRPDLVFWSLWSCDRRGNVQGIFSHQTALAIHDLSDVMPARYHLTVPKKFRKFHATPENIVLGGNSLWVSAQYSLVVVTRPVRLECLLGKEIPQRVPKRTFCHDFSL